MEMKDFVERCKKCDPRNEPDEAAELLASAAELGAAILKQREKYSKIPYKQIVDSYNEICGNVLPKVTKLTDKRKRAIKTCISQGFSAEDLSSAFQSAVKTPFLTGKNERNWTANFDFIVKPDNLQKILEGVYGSAPAACQKHSYDLGKLVDHAMNTTPTIRR